MSDNNRRGALPPGFDAENPYEDEVLTEYPEWWRNHIEEFQDRGMRPYRPPKLTDGENMTELVNEMEAEYGIEIAIKAFNPQEGNKWGIFVDNERAALVGHHRAGEGYSVYEISSNELKEKIREHI